MMMKIRWLKMERNSFVNRAWLELPSVTSIYVTCVIGPYTRIAMETVPSWMHDEGMSIMSVISVRTRSAGGNVPCEPMYIPSA